MIVAKGLRQQMDRMAKQYEFQRVAGDILERLGFKADPSSEESEFDRG